MSKHVNHAQELRNIEVPHHNCAQSTLMPFAKECGLTEEQAFAVASCFGRGMRIESVCGAVTGGLMALGLKGATAEQQAEFIAKFKEKHNNMIICHDLLAKCDADGQVHKTHCDGCVCDAVAIVEDIMG